MEGVVIKSTGSWYTVRSNGTIYNCRIVGKLRLDELRSTNPIAVGDNVAFTLENKLEGQINEVLPRRNYVVRQSPRKKHNVHLIASNVDQALLVVTIKRPDVKTGFIDRFLMMTEPYDIPVIIVFNKWDIYNAEDKVHYEYLKDIYTSIGHHVVHASAESGENLAYIKELLQDKITLAAGQSGVGKTSLINAIEPSLSLKMGEISDYTGKGQHTTTFAEMLPLTFGGDLIDTPGIKTLGFNHFELLDVAHNFKEIFKASSACKYNNCTHRNEPKCAVKDLVEVGGINEIRYGNYLQILEEVEDQNYWERHKDI